VSGKKKPAKSPRKKKKKGKGTAASVFVKTGPGTREKGGFRPRFGSVLKGKGRKVTSRAGSDHLRKRRLKPCQKKRERKDGICFALARKRGRGKEGARERKRRLIRGTSPAAGFKISKRGEGRGPCYPARCNEKKKMKAFFRSPYSVACANR